MLASYIRVPDQITNGSSTSDPASGAGSWRAAGSASRTLAPATHMGERGGVWPLVSEWRSPGCCSHLRVKLKENFSHCHYWCHSDCQTDENKHFVFLYKKKKEKNAAMLTWKSSTDKTEHPGTED